MFQRLILVTLVLLFISPLANASKPEIYSSIFGGAINGYDPVAYFTQGKPVKGKRAYRVEYKGASWSFASNKNRQAFKQNPNRYMPQYGGYCAYAVSQGYTASTDPNAWSIVNNKLYLNYSKGVRSKWNIDRPGYIKKANSNWPKVLK
ncbi:MAG: YHS domain-containing protein [Gammaproteobacteria bacterium]|nr:YHS domain-containing protein [Gammaproteobacteria bacterium]